MIKFNDTRRPFSWKPTARLPVSAGGGAPKWKSLNRHRELWSPPWTDRLTDTRHDWKHYLSPSTHAGGNENDKKMITSFSGHANTALSKPAAGFIKILRLFKTPPNQHSDPFLSLVSWIISSYPVSSKAPSSVGLSISGIASVKRKPVKKMYKMCKNFHE